MDRRYMIGILTVMLAVFVVATPACIEGFNAALGETRLITSGDPSEPPTRGSGGGEGNPDAGDVASHGNFDQPDMFTGTASYRYELKLPPSTNNMAPKLALVYRSTGDNGWFGMGWEMEGLGYIEYSHKSGVPKYNGTDKDFVLNMGGSTYELIPDDSNDDPAANTGYYHTRCETWMKIYFNGSFWTITDRNGVEWRFGYNADARVPIAGDPTIRLWALDRVLDKHGNYMSYSYALDAPNGEYYPDTITYTRNMNTTLGQGQDRDLRPGGENRQHPALCAVDGIPNQGDPRRYRRSAGGTVCD